MGVDSIRYPEEPIDITPLNDEITKLKAEIEMLKLRAKKIETDVNSLRQVK